MGWLKKTKRHRGQREELQTNRLTHAIIGAAIKVYNRSGPGFLESTYRVCLPYELKKREFDVIVEKPILQFNSV